MTPAAQDATESFEEIGHSNAARELLNKYYIGEYEVGLQLANTICQLHKLHMRCVC